MITITNISGDPFGKCEYEVKSNRELLATFTHDRTDGLATCLRKAANAVEKAKWEAFAETFNEKLANNMARSHTTGKGKERKEKAKTKPVHGYQPESDLDLGNPPEYE